MDGRNSSGRKISLLNEDASSAPFYHSRTSSYTSTPCLSPQTPHLVRSDSTDSAIMQTPSPITPDLAFEGLAMPQPVPSPVFPYFQQQKDAIYPAVPQSSGPLPYPTGIPVQPPMPHSPPQALMYPQQAVATAAVPAPTASERRQPSSTNGKSKKNSYPCPMARQYNCNDYFTTSGHAARHAKKHTGKKDAYCPECNKAFTRKDNMEQHRRTHQNGRSTGKSSASSGSGDGARKVTKSQLPKRPKPAPLQTQMPLVDPALPISPTSSFGFVSALSGPGAVTPYGSEYAISRSAYPDPTQFSQHPINPVDNLQRSPSFALDALAIACSEKRNYGT